MRLAVLFPGQGSQFVGMGAELFDLRPDLLGEKANTIVGFDLMQMCLEGPEEALTRTEHAQPALFAVAYALWDEIGPRLPAQPSAMAGHSLGEYTALAASGVLSYETALSIVARRGKAMAKAAVLEPSGMAALVGADFELATDICERRVDDGGRLSVANINTPTQIVVAGGEVDIQWLAENGREMGVRRVIPLKVAGAFHSQFMESAAAEVAAAFEGAHVGEPLVPVWANTTAAPHAPADVARLMARQVVEPVRFADSLQGIGETGIDTFLHVGPGEVTAGLAKKTLEGAATYSISSIDDLVKLSPPTVSMDNPEEGP